MKKILGVSIAALLAVTPMLASATAITGATYTDPTNSTTDNAATTAPQYQTVGIDTEDQGHIASTAYVKGAYNSAIRAVNKVYDVATTAASTALESAAGSGLTWNSTSKDFDVVVDGSTIEVDSTNGIQIKEGGVDTAQLKTSAVTTDKIADSNVTAVKLASDSVTTAKILDANVTTAKIADSNVTTAKIADSNVTTAKIADDAVTNAKIADNAVDTAQIVDGAVNADKLASGLVTGGVRSAAAAALDTDAQAYDADETIASEKAVRAAIDTATTDMATQTGVVATLGSSYVTLYTDWAHQTYTQNVGISNQGYVTSASAIPAGVSQ